MKVPPRRALIVLSLVAAGALVAGTAYAAIPRTPGGPALVGCVNTSTGALRMVDPARGQACTRRETPLPSAVVGAPAAPAVNESAIRDAVNRAVAQALAAAGPPRGGAPLGLRNLDQLAGLPCNVGTRDAGVVRIRYAPPRSGSGITLVCLSDSTVTTFPTPSPTVPPTTISPTIISPPDPTIEPPTEPTITPTSAPFPEPTTEMPPSP